MKVYIIEGHPQYRIRFDNIVYRIENLKKFWFFKGKWIDLSDQTLNGRTPSVFLTLNDAKNKLRRYIKKNDSEMEQEVISL
jgi:hypothetical protein